jgi:LPS-assembly protein
MRMAIQVPLPPRLGRKVALALVLLMCATAAAGITAIAAARPQGRISARHGIVTLEADQQRQEGKMFYADGNVDVRFEDMRLRADHVVYNDETKIAIARGHVQFDRGTQHLDAEQASYNLQTGTGTFRHVQGTIKVERRPNPNLLVSPNPLYFEAAEVDRVDERTYIVRDATITVCAPDSPKWKFYAPRATIFLQRSVHLENATFRLFSVPIIYLPYATAPAGAKLRQSGFLIPDVGQSSRKGFVFGDAYYWAPTEWLDTTLGAQLFSRRGWSQTASLRARPWENVRIDASYFGVIDRGLLESGIRVKQGGHEDHFGVDGFLPGGWRAVADLNQLTSLTFRLAFSETFTQAVNSEVRNTAFLTNNFHGFSLSFAALSYKNFLNAENVQTSTPETAIVLRTAPEARFSSVDQAPWGKLPIYFGFDAFADAVHRGDTVPPGFQSPSFVSRTEFAPNVTIPLRWGPWLGVVPSFTLRSTRYGTQLESNGTFGPAFVRTTEEFSLDLRPPAFARVWERRESKWKHDIEPDVVYRYVNGVNDFGRFIRFDEDETLTDTNEVEYSLTQRLYRRSGEDDAEELISWRVAQKYFFDPTFGGALVPGQRNVFQTLDALTPFAFADAARRFSPVISDLRITPGGRYDAQFRVDYDPKRGRADAFGTLLKVRPYRESFITVAEFSVLNLPPAASSSSTAFLPRSNQIRALVGYGDLNRQGFNTAVGFSYDVTQKAFQNQVVQLSYNGTCCGIGLEYRRLSLGNVRVDNQFRIVLLIANIGSAGNLRRQEKVF